MPKFFKVTHGGSADRRFAWAARINAGLDRGVRCDECGAVTLRPRGDVCVEIDQDACASAWPDIMGCGHYPLFIVSGCVLDDWRSMNVGDVVAHHVNIAERIPRGLREDAAPSYFWLDGEEMLGARIDFEESGFVGVRFCATCGRRTDDIEATFDRQEAGVWPYIFANGSWSGAKLFTTDLSPTAFFCTDLVVAVAGKKRHTNFKFVPIERAASSTVGIEYMD